MWILLAYEHVPYLQCDLFMLQAVKTNCNHNHQLAWDSNTVIASTRIALNNSSCKFIFYGLHRREYGEMTE